MIIVRISDGLGNQMFQYAFARALYMRGNDVKIDLQNSFLKAFDDDWKYMIREKSIRNLNIRIPEIDVYNYGKYNYLMRDTISKRLVFMLSEKGLWKYKFLEGGTRYDRELLDIKGDYYIRGWYQSEKYFKNIRDILVREFKPKRKIKISSDIGQLLNEEECVSIHIRRGDYILFGNTLDLIYYDKAVAKIKERYKKPIFLIFSDDLEWTKEHLTIDGQTFYVNEDRTLKDYEELLIMSRCKSNIIANSTFSWWGAWLNQNPEKWVIAPKKWQPQQADILPEEWIKL